MRVFVSHFSNDSKKIQWNSKTYSIDNDYMWNTDVYYDLFWFGESKSTKAEMRALMSALKHKHP